MDICFTELHMNLLDGPEFCSVASYFIEKCFSLYLKDQC